MLKVTFENVPEGVREYQVGYHLNAIYRTTRQFCMSFKPLNLKAEDISIEVKSDADSNIDRSGGVPVIVLVEPLDDRPWSELQRQAFVQGLLGAVLPELRVPGFKQLHAHVILRLFHKEHDAVAAA